ncbi:MAG: hypothetical protein K0Q94_443 [Paenibacillus sp.]|nr:hypothetical protein [Paenibacillus sp.]
MKEKKETFNEVAQLYDEARNRYPEITWPEAMNAFLSRCSLATSGISRVPFPVSGCRKLQPFSPIRASSKKAACSNPRS